MIRIKNRHYKIIRRVDEVDEGQRHLTLIVNGKVSEEVHNQQHHLSYINQWGDEESFTGIILFPHYNKDNGTTMFLVYVEE